MRTSDIKELFKELLKNNLHERINTSELKKGKPQVSLIQDVKIAQPEVELTEDQIDDLREGELVNVQFEVSGTYSINDETSGLVIQNQRFITSMGDLSIKFDDEKLIIESGDFYARTHH